MPVGLRVATTEVILAALTAAPGATAATDEAKDGLARLVVTLDANAVGEAAPTSASAVTTANDTSQLYPPARTRPDDMGTRTSWSSPTPPFPPVVGLSTPAKARRRRAGVAVTVKPFSLLSGTPAAEATVALRLASSVEVGGAAAAMVKVSATLVVSPVVGARVGSSEGCWVGLRVRAPIVGAGSGIGTVDGAG